MCMQDETILSKENMCNLFLNIEIQKLSLLLKSKKLSLNIKKTSTFSNIYS